MWQWMTPVTSTLPTATTTASAAWIPRELSPLSREPGSEAPAGTAGRQSRRNWPSPPVVAADSAGNLYIADSSNHRIRRVDSSGTITTVAGGGSADGDNVPAVQARLSRPSGVVLDGAGNLYIADTSNHRIRRVDSSGTITTVAGTGERGFGGDGGPAVQAQLASPFGVAVDSAGNLFIADTLNSRIRRLDTKGTITTVAGTGEESFGGDGGPALQAQLARPIGIALDGSGNIYLASVFNQRIRRVDSSGTITTVAGTGTSGFNGDRGPAVRAQLDNPEGVAVDGAGNLYIADRTNNRIRRVDASGTITTIAGGSVSADGDPADQAQLNNPSGVGSTVPATSTSPIPATSAFTGCIRRPRSPRLQAPGNPITAGTMARPYGLGLASPQIWQSTAAATSTSPILPTTAFAG